MKTFAKYILALGLLALTVSCENPFSAKDLSEADMVEVTMSVILPEPVEIPTKAKMGEGPTSDAFDIYLCIYGSGNGYVQNWIHPTLSDPIIENGYLKGGKFKALIPIAHDKRVIHVIANPPKAVTEPYVFDYMGILMEQMVTKLGTDEECSYWQQIVLNDISAGDHESSTPGIPVASSLVLNAFKDIYLVRNFAKVVVTSDLLSNNAKFQVNRWTLINVPDKAYVAPYTGNDAENSRFPSGYLNIKNLLLDHDLYDQLTDVDNYPGNMPPTAKIDESFPSDLTKYAVRDGAQYMYERPLPTTEQEQTAVLMEVTFAEGQNPGSRDDRTYWYKIELLDDNLEYVPFLRDIVYTLNIQDLKEAGYATAEDAYNGAYFGNISASLETAGLNELSDGKSLIHVDRMDYTFLTGGGTEILSKDGTPNPGEGNIAQFYFVPDVTADPESPGYAYTASTANTCEIKVELMAAGGSAPAVTACTPNYENGTISVTLAETDPNVIKKSIIRVSGRKGNPGATNTNKFIYREITITLMATQDFKHEDDETTIVGSPTITGAGNPVKFRVCLPEGLSASAFPIQVRIEAENNTLTARTNDLPVEIGRSVFESKNGKNTYFYIYTINFSDYRKLNADNKYVYTYDFYFTLYTSNLNNNSTKIDLRDLGEKFNPKVLTLGTP